MKKLCSGWDNGAITGIKDDIGLETGIKDDIGLDIACGTGCGARTGRGTAASASQVSAPVPAPVKIFTRYVVACHPRLPSTSHISRFHIFSLS